MGLFDKAKQAISGNKGQVKQGIDKAADAIDDKAGTHADKVQKGAEMAKDQVDKLDGGTGTPGDDRNPPAGGTAV